VVLTEFNAGAATPQFPGVKAHWALLIEEKIKQVADLSGAPLIVYASACTVPAGKGVSELLAIDLSDKIGFHSMLEDVSGPKLDVLIHSPGGFAEPTEAIVEEIRSKFGFVRFIVPSFAKSAATMMAMSGDQILMDEHAELGPIDPQMSTRNGNVAADAIRQQLKKASDEILADPKKAQVWFPILQMLGPGLLSQCDNASKLSKDLVTNWLTKYMFRGVPDGSAKASTVADYLSDHPSFLSHGRRVTLDQLQQRDVSAVNLRDDPSFYKAVWELYCTIDIILSNTPAYKIFYNSSKTAMIRNNVQGGSIQLLNMPFPRPNFPMPIPAPIPTMPAPEPAAPVPPLPTSVAPGATPVPAKAKRPGKAQRRPTGRSRKAR
jgi:hypothetical protein